MLFQVTDAGFQSSSFTESFSLSTLIVLRVWFQRGWRCQQPGFSQFLLAPVTPVCNQDFRLFSCDSFDLLKGGFNRMSIVGISRQCQGSETNPALTGSGDRDFGPEFVGFMGVAFGNATDMRFVKAIDFLISTPAAYSRKYGIHIFSKKVWNS